MVCGKTGFEEDGVVHLSFERESVNSAEPAERSEERGFTHSKMRYY